MASTQPLMTFWAASSLPLPSSSPPVGAAFLDHPWPSGRSHGPKLASLHPPPEPSPRRPRNSWYSDHKAAPILGVSHNRCPRSTPRSSLSPWFPKSFLSSSSRVGGWSTGAATASRGGGVLARPRSLSPRLDLSRLLLLLLLLSRRRGRSSLSLSLSLSLPRSRSRSRSRSRPPRSLLVAWSRPRLLSGVLSRSRLNLSLPPPSLSLGLLLLSGRRLPVVASLSLPSLTRSPRSPREDPPALLLDGLSGVVVVVKLSAPNWWRPFFSLCVVVWLLVGFSLAWSRRLLRSPPPSRSTSLSLSLLPRSLPPRRRVIATLPMASPVGSSAKTRLPKKKERYFVRDVLFFGPVKNSISEAPKKERLSRNTVHFLEAKTHQTAQHRGDETRGFGGAVAEAVSGVKRKE